MTKRTLYTLVFAFLLSAPNSGKAESAPNDSLVLDLQSVIQIAQSQSPSAQSAKNSSVPTTCHPSLSRPHLI